MIYSLTIRNMALVRKYQFDAQNLDEKNAHKLDHQTTMKLIVKQHDLIFILIWLVREEKLSRQNKVETKRFRSMKENCELWEAVWVIRQGWGLTPGWPASWAAWQAGGGGGGGGGVQQVRCSPFTRSLAVASGARVWWRWKRLYRRPHNRAATLTGSKGSRHKDTCSAWHHPPPPLPLTQKCQETAFPFIFPNSSISRPQLSTRFWRVWNFFAGDGQQLKVSLGIYFRFHQLLSTCAHHDLKCVRQRIEREIMRSLSVITSYFYVHRLPNFLCIQRQPNIFLKSSKSRFCYAFTYATHILLLCQLFWSFSLADKQLIIGLWNMLLLWRVTFHVLFNFHFSKACWSLYSVIFLICL